MNVDKLTTLALLGIPATYGTAKAWEHLNTLEPLQDRLKKVTYNLSEDFTSGPQEPRRNPNMNKFLSFKEAREKIASAMEKTAAPGDRGSMGNAKDITMFSAINNLLGKGMDVTKPISDVLGYKLYKTLFPGLQGMMERFAIPEEAFKSMATGATGEIGKTIAGGLGKTVKDIMDRSKQVSYYSPRRQAILNSLRSEDEILGKLPEEKAREYYHTMSKIAPTLSVDKNAVKSFLRAAATSEGGIDWNTIKSLADTEKSMLQATGQLPSSGK